MLNDPKNSQKLSEADLPEPFFLDADGDLLTALLKKPSASQEEPEVVLDPSVLEYYDDLDQ